MNLKIIPKLISSRFYLLIILNIFLLSTAIFALEKTDVVGIMEEQSFADAYVYKRKLLINKLLLNFDLSQTSYDNWIQGGENSLDGRIELKADFMINHSGYNLANKGKIAYGISKIGDYEPYKTLDEIKLETIYTKKNRSIPDFYGSIYGQTQFSYGYSYELDSKIKVSNFMDPAYFIQSIGFSYTLPNKDFNIQLGCALRETISDEFSAIYTDDSETEDIEKIKIEKGLQSIATFNKHISDNTLIGTSFKLFSNLEGIKKTYLYWENDITVEMSRYFSININFELLYDSNISVKRQIKQFLSLRFNWWLYRHRFYML